MVQPYPPATGSKALTPIHRDHIITPDMDQPHHARPAFRLGPGRSSPTPRVYSSLNSASCCISLLGWSLPFVLCFCWLFLVFCCVRLNFCISGAGPACWALRWVRAVGSSRCAGAASSWPATALFLLFLRAIFAAGWVVGCLGVWVVGGCEDDACCESGERRRMVDERCYILSLQ